MLVRLAGMVRESVVDGGTADSSFRLSTPLSGYHNPETWDSVSGILADSEEVLAAIGYPGLISVTSPAENRFSNRKHWHLKECKRRGFHIMVPGI